MKPRFSPLPMSFFMLLSFFPFLARAQPQPSNPQDIKPPQLLSPVNDAVVKGSPEFFWTSAVLPRGFRGSYKLKVVPVSQGQSPDAALAGNSPVHQATMRRTGEAYPASGPQLKNGQTYAWCVQVVDANGSPIGENQGMSEVFTFSFESAPQAPPPVSPTPGAASVSINTQALQMTGMRVESVTINTLPLQMTGMRVNPVSINTPPLQMTGMRETDESPPDGGNVTPVQPDKVKEAKIKLDLPFKKPETIDGVKPPVEQPEGTQKKIRGTGQVLDGTAGNKLPADVPAMTTPSIPEKPVDGTTKLPLQQKTGVKKTIDDASTESKTSPVSPPSGAVIPAGTGDSQKGQKLQNVKESPKVNTTKGDQSDKTKTDVKDVKSKNIAPAGIQNPVSIEKKGAEKPLETGAK